MRRRRDEQCVAIRRRLRDEPAADAAAGAGAILDDDRLTQWPANLLGNQPRDEIGRAARADRNDDLDRPLGILRARGR